MRHLGDCLYLVETGIGLRLDCGSIAGGDCLQSEQDQCKPRNVDLSGASVDELGDNRALVEGEENYRDRAFKWLSRVVMTLLALSGFVNLLNLNAQFRMEISVPVGFGEDIQCSAASQRYGVWGL